MTTLSANKPRKELYSDVAEYPMIASDIIYEGAAVGLVTASGHARPLTSGDAFGGFAEATVDNSTGAAAAQNVRCRKRGCVLLPVTGATITDVKLPVYATDDDTFTFSPVGGVFIGIARQFDSSGSMFVEYDTENMIDPWAGYTAETVSTAKTLDAQDAGKLFYVTADATITFQAVDGMKGVVIMNGGSYGSVAVTLDPNASDMIEMKDITAADNKDIVNTKATANRGDFVLIGAGDANGWTVSKSKGIWAREA